MPKAIDIKCPACSAAPGQQCIRAGSMQPHQERLDKAAGLGPDPEVHTVHDALPSPQDVLAGQTLKLGEERRKHLKLIRTKLLSTDWTDQNVSLSYPITGLNARLIQQLIDCLQKAGWHAMPFRSQKDGDSLTIRAQAQGGEVNDDPA